MYLAIRCLTKGYLLEWMKTGNYEYENEAILDKEEVLKRVDELLSEAEDTGDA
jgi:hypothetical protein